MEGDIVYIVHQIVIKHSREGNWMLLNNLPVSTIKLPKRQLSFITYPCEKIIEKWNGLRVKQSYMLEEQALAYHMSWEMKTP